MHDWALMEVFLRVAEAGSMSAATGALGLSQSTISRRITSLESQRGGPLFNRHGRGLALTEGGRRLRDGAREIDGQLDALLRPSNGSIDAHVTVSAPEPVAAFVLPEAYRRLGEAYPTLTLEIRAEERVSNLSMGEADIALRISNSTQPELVLSRVGHLALGFYASRDYILLHGEPRSLSELRRHRLLGTSSSVRADAFTRSLGLDPSDIRFRTDSSVTLLQAVVAGAGIAGLPTDLELARPELQRVLVGVALPTFPLWLAVHRTQGRMPAIRAVLKAIRHTMRVRRSPHRGTLRETEALAVKITNGKAAQQVLEPDGG